jgi:hypothetical protein
MTSKEKWLIAGWILPVFPGVIFAYYSLEELFLVNLLIAAYGLGYGYSEEK